MAVKSSIGKVSKVLNRETGQVKTKATDVNPLTKNLRQWEEVTYWMSKKGGGGLKSSQPVSDVSSRIGDPATSAARRRRDMEQTSSLTGPLPTDTVDSFSSDTTLTDITSSVIPPTQPNMLPESEQEASERLWTPDVTTDTNKDFILWADELWGAEKTVYDMLSPTEKKQFDAIWEAARKKGQDYVKSQVEYLRKRKQQRDYITSQNDTKNEINSLDRENQNIQRDERLRQHRESIRNMKTNLAYLWTMWRPGVSMAQLDAVSDQVATAETTYQKLVDMEDNLDRIKDLWQEYDAAAFDRELKLLDDDLDLKVNKAIQQALNIFSAAELEGKLDSLDEVEALRTQLLQGIDEEIVGVTDASIQQRGFLIERYEAIAENKRLYIENKSTVNQDMSTAKGYYVDGNGDPIISAETGQPIIMPETPPMEPIFDKESWRLVQFFYDDEGNIMSKVDQIIEQPTFAEAAISNYATLVAQGKLDIKDVPDQVKNTEAFVDMLVSTPFSEKKDEDGNLGNTVKVWEKTYQRNPKTQRYDIEVGGSSSSSPTIDPENEVVTGAKASELIMTGNVQSLADSMEYGVAYDCGTRWECGQRYNDAVGWDNGTWMWDTYASKQQHIDYWVTQWEEWMGVVFNYGWSVTPYGHVWVLASGPYTNADGVAGYDVISANIAGDKKLSKDFVPESLIAGSGGWFVPTKFKEQQPSWMVPENADAYIKLTNTKVIASASKITDSERENIKKSMEEAVQSWDLAYANEILRWVILEDKRVGDTVYDNLELKTGLGNLRSILEEYKASGGNTNILTSIAEKWANYRWITTNEQLAKAKNQLWVLVADYIRAISGTAASDTEVARLLGNMPNIKNVDSFNTTILDNLENIANNRMQTWLETFLWNYKNLWPELFPEAYAQTQATWTTQQAQNPEGWTPEMDAMRNEIYPQ